jgi:hypothetical protein
MAVLWPPFHFSPQASFITLRSGVTLRCMFHLSHHLQECQGRSAGPTAAAAAAAAAAAPLQAVAGASSSSSSSQQMLLQRGQQRPFHVPHAREDAADDDESSTPAITFKLLMKKAGKDDRSRELHVSHFGLWVYKTLTAALMLSAHCSYPELRICVRYLVRAELQQHFRITFNPMATCC